MGINRVMLTGNLTRDPELRRSQAGMAIMGFGLAVNDRRKNSQTGEWQDYANFVECTLFGSRAESLSNLLEKGMKVAIEGKLRWSQWERDGQRRSKLEVVVETIEFMFSKSHDDNQNSYGSNYNQNSYSQADSQQSQYRDGVSGDSQTPSVNTSSEVYDDDIPF